MYPEQTGKDKAARVPLNYYAPVRPRWLKYAIGFGAPLLVVALVWVRGRGVVAASPGPVSHAHAAFEHDCAACHAGPCAPTSAENFLHPPPGGASPADGLCRRCHEAPAHHASATPVPSCAACHREHRGRAARTTAVQDEACVVCHADLTEHHLSRTPAFERGVKEFAAHPRFKVGPFGTGPPAAPRTRLSDVRTQDPGRLRFNHQVHVSPRLERRGKQLGPLRCEACHQLDGTPEVPAGLAAGAYYLPVRFDAHCKQCHPLTWPLTATASVTFPHHLQPGEIRELLFGALVARGLGLRPDPPPGPDRPLPGQAEPDAVRGRAAPMADKLVFEGQAGCGLCHGLTPGNPAAVLPTAVPAVWLPHATFSHLPHRTFRCEECHPGAAGSSSSADVLIPDIDTCRKCHGAEAEGTTGAGAARAACVGCHTYHGDRPPNRPAARVPPDERRQALEGFFRRR